MFDHKHYVPVLKGKRAEFPAIGKLHSKNGITPLLEAVPDLPPDYVPKKMSSVWDNNRPYFIDMLFIDDEDMAEEEAANHPITACFAEVANQGHYAIPATGTGRSRAYQTAVRTIVGTQNKGFAIRLVPDDFDDEDEFPEILAALVDFMGVSRANIDIVIDLGSVADQPLAQVSRTHRILLPMIPTIAAWRTLTISAGAFPLGLGSLATGWNTVSRNDWLGWESTLSRSLPRKPSYGDYGIAHPNLPPTGRATILAQLRYSTPSNFFVYKGHNVFRHADGFNQFRAICRDLINNRLYRGQGFSFGDEEIDAKATTGDSPGNAERWRLIGTNHHLETVKDQIANHAGL